MKKYIVGQQPEGWLLGNPMNPKKKVLN